MKFTGPRRLSRRELTRYFLTFSLAVPTVGTMATSGHQRQRPLASLQMRLGEP